ncbi:transglycosylase domain-containing protein [Filibacter tadaridae]|uniref:Penicillin-binding protein 1F n=1 Tax=Filibacter tadaridae TaxID=2483811 RepID=A0A3P5XHN1_9BACL|nr:transglycosylase domain-containing protein [Filibacter tadaridae]VDC28218.1 Penicillin-binding protein 1F [Filibacter tadaridae]
MNASHLASETVRPAIKTRKQIIKERKKFSKKKWLFFYPLLLILITYCAVIAAGSILMDDSKLTELEQIRSSATFVTTEQMPEYVPEAFISIEDHRFYHHLGIDPISMTRALFVDLKTQSFAQGGSTITMQLAKNQFLTQEKSIKRKLKEIIIAINLERMYTKDELVEMYLNTIYFGHGQYGIEQAANFYFGKTFFGDSNSKEPVTLSEAATLASLPKGPEIYSPFKHPEKAFNRQAVVLTRMNDLGIITQTEKEAAVWKSVDELPVQR